MRFAVNGFSYTLGNQLRYICKWTNIKWKLVEMFSKLTVRNSKVDIIQNETDHL